MAPQILVAIANFCRKQFSFFARKIERKVLLAAFLLHISKPKKNNNGNELNSATGEVCPHI